MGQINVRSFDMKYAMPEKMSAKKDGKEVSDDFKKLLGESSDEQTAAQSGAEVSKQPDGEADPEAKSGEKADDAKADGMYSAMQAGQLLWGMQNVQRVQTDAVYGTVPEGEVTEGGVQEITVETEIPGMSVTAEENPSAEVRTVQQPLTEDSGVKVQPESLFQHPGEIHQKAAGEVKEQPEVMFRQPEVTHQETAGEVKEQPEVMFQQPEVNLQKTAGEAEVQPEVVLQQPEVTHQETAGEVKEQPEVMFQHPEVNLQKAAGEAEVQPEAALQQPGETHQKAAGEVKEQPETMRQQPEQKPEADTEVHGQKAPVKRVSSEKRPERAEHPEKETAKTAQDIRREDTAVKPEEKLQRSERSEEQPDIVKTASDTRVQEQYIPQAAETTQSVSDTVPVQQPEHVRETMHVAQPEEIPEKLPEEIMTKLSHGIREFEVQIEPEHLGRIAIKVNYEDDQTVISIACSEKKTLEMIGRSAREIGSIMEKNLGTETEVYVEEKAEDYSDRQQNDNDHSGRQSEQERQREESRKNKTDDSGQFLQRLRLGLVR